MSAPSDRSNDPNSVSYYAPRGARPTRLPPVEPMPALMPEAPPPSESRTSLVAANDPFEGDIAVQRLRARRSLDPEFAPAPPLPLRNRSWLAVVSRLVMVILAAAVVALIAIGQFPFPTGWRQPASDRGVELASTSTRSVPAVAGKGVETVIPRLLVQGSRGMSGEPAPLGVTLQGRADGGVIMITGLAAGMMLSNGSAVGADAWQVPATDAVLANTWILPPKDFVGAVDLVAELHLADATIAHRRPIRLEWAAPPPPPPPAAAPAVVAAAPAAVAATPPAAAAVPTQRSLAPPAAAAPPATAAPPVAAAPPPVAAAPPAPPRQATPPRQLDRDEIAVLVKRGKDFIANGDLAAARLVLQRAAESKDAEAALSLAATYDPLVLRELKVYGFASDIAMARMWYEKAKEFGSPEAPRRLEILAGISR
jgi:hypothetical protein